MPAEQDKASAKGILIRYGAPPAVIQVVGREGHRWRQRDGLLLDDNAKVYLYTPELAAEFGRIYRQYRGGLDAWHEQLARAPKLSVEDLKTEREREREEADRGAYAPVQGEA